MASGFLNVTWDSFSDPPGFGGIFTHSFFFLRNCQDRDSLRILAGSLGRRRDLKELLRCFQDSSMRLGILLGSFVILRDFHGSFLGRPTARIGIL